LDRLWWIQHAQEADDMFRSALIEFGIVILMVTVSATLILLGQQLGGRLGVRIAGGLCLVLCAIGLALYLRRTFRAAREERTAGTRRRPQRAVRQRFVNHFLRFLGQWTATWLFLFTGVIVSALFCGRMEEVEMFISLHAFPAYAMLLALGVVLGAVLAGIACWFREDGG